MMESEEHDIPSTCSSLMTESTMPEHCQGRGAGLWRPTERVCRQHCTLQLLHFFWERQCTVISQPATTLPTWIVPSSQTLILSSASTTTAVQIRSSHWCMWTPTSNTKIFLPVMRRAIVHSLCLIWKEGEYITLTNVPQWRCRSAIGSLTFDVVKSMDLGIRGPNESSNSEMTVNPKPPTRLFATLYPTTTVFFTMFKSYQSLKLDVRSRNRWLIRFERLATVAKSIPHYLHHNVTSEMTVRTLNHRQDCWLLYTLLSQCFSTTFKSYPSPIFRFEIGIQKSTWCKHTICIIILKSAGDMCASDLPTASAFRWRCLGNWCNQFELTVGTGASVSTPRPWGRSERGVVLALERAKCSVWPLPSFLSFISVAGSFDGAATIVGQRATNVSC